MKENLRYLLIGIRKQMGLNLTQFSNQANIPYSTLNRIELGKILPSLEHLENYSKLSNYSISNIIYTAESNLGNLVGLIELGKSSTKKGKKVSLILNQLKELSPEERESILKQLNVC